VLISISKKEDHLFLSTLIFVKCDIEIHCMLKNSELLISIHQLI